MAVTAAMVKELRESTGAGMMDAKKALTETNGDMEAAVDWLRTKGLAKAAKKADRIAAEGLVGVQVTDGRGVAVEMNSETDFVAKNADFQQLVREITNVALTTADDVEVLRATHLNGKPVSELISTATPLPFETATPIRPSAATRSAFLAALASPLVRSQSTAASMSPFVSVSAFLASIMPAPVESRSSFTIAAVIVMVSLLRIDGPGGMNPPGDLW